MAGACDVGKLSEGGCELKKPPPGAIMSPWVNIRFDKSGVQITVGNKSCPTNNHHAVIKDFEFGHSDGLECRVTIIDEQGSSFVKFMEDILKDSRCICPGAYTMHVDFGWVMDSCPAGTSSKKNKQTYHMMCDNIECNFTGGKFLFQIVGTDIGPQVFAHKFEKTMGDDKNKMHLTDAIRTMFTDCKYPPAIASVKFQKWNQGGGIQPIIFDITKDDKGPKEKWEPLGKDKINTALNWLAPYITTDQKGIIATFNSEVPGGEMIFWEDFQPGCGQTKNWESNCIGTYLVNGGKDSSVLEFNPRIKWDFFSLTSTGGNMGEGKVVLNKDGKVKGRHDCFTINRDSAPAAGNTNTAPVAEHTRNQAGKQSADITAIGNGQQQKAFRLFHNDIEADLVIIGDPEIMRPSEAIWAKNVKVVFINPYHIFDGAVAGCGEWLAAPLCNEVLSNKAWNVKAITHRISDGKFTTTIQVYLSAPGTVLDIGEPLGGAGSGGWTPPKAC